MKKNKIYIFIVAITVMLVSMLFLDTLIVFRMTSEQTREKGKYQLESISGELESTINDAKNFTMEIALSAQTYLDDKEKLKEFIYSNKKKLGQNRTSGYNIYIAGKDWDIIPDLVNREGYYAADRSWYIGALRNNGEAFVTPPYTDAATGNICYTVSVMLPDGETVLGVDYTMANIQIHVTKMNETGLHNAVIVTEDGTIAGGSDESLIGDTLMSRLPEYSAIFYLAKKSGDFVTHRIKSGMLYENLFAAKSGSGWYLIVSESDWELYGNSYLQLIIIVTLTLALIGIIVTLYIFSMRDRRKAEEALKSGNEFLSRITKKLEMPLKQILAGSDTDTYPDTDSISERLSGIHEAGTKLSDMIAQIVSYSDVVKLTGKKEKKIKLPGKKISMNKRFRNLILFMMIFVMAVSLTATVFLSVKLARSEMSDDVSKYEYCLSEWIYKQKSILDMFASIISSEPERLDDYEGTVKYLDNIAKQYPEISVVYMTNPKLKHTVYMNNGWQPDENWHVEERQWYIDTLASPDGWSISAPYYDEQTGLYCVTFSEQVHDIETGEFLGNFGIDFYMDKLVDILGGSYSENGYAFLTDAAGNIINHPYGKYQMSVESTTNVSDLRYSELRADGKSVLIIRDYDGKLRIVNAKRSELSNFVVYKAAGFWKIYAQGTVVWLICFIVLTASIIMVYKILSRLIFWYDNVNQHMKEAADAATAAGKAKSRFLAHMSHEIRTPINAVLGLNEIGMNEMILRKSGDPEITEYSENIKTAGNTLLSLINSILDFSKIEDGKMEIIPVEYDTVSMINNVIHFVSVRAEKKGLKLIVNADPELPCGLVGDDVRLMQVIVNLLTNAVKYTEHGSITFTAECKERSENDIILAVSVKDTGIGIRTEDMDKLCESFSRIDEEHNRNIEGTGLGMAIVTKLLSLMDSKLSVESVYGSGSEFSFEIKQGISDPKPIGENIERRSDSRINSEKGQKIFKGADILVTDDNEMNIKVAKNLLKLFGINADTASSGAETIELIKKKHYHIVFLDHMMPQMDGIETLHRIKEEKLAENDTVIIALTANAIMGAKETYLKEGFDDYLSKPIEFSVLEDKLIHYLPEHIANQEVSADEEILEFEPNEDEEILEFEPMENDGDFISLLEKSGFNTVAGIGYCANDKEFYLEMLREYADTAEERISQINKALDENNINDYRVYVHALKSVSKTIGADDISEQAKELEMSAKNNDTEFIKANNRNLIDNFRSKIKILNNILK